MTTLLYTHDASLDHVTPRGHPERVARIEAVTRALATPGFAALERRQAPLADDALLRLCHPQAHLDAITAALPTEGAAPLDPDTWVSPGSDAAARRAAGAVAAAVDAVLSGEAANAFCALRPPGHHAEAERAMGFCLYGSAAIGARHALAKHGLARVAVVDFDVHHGNGTQALLWDAPGAFYGSSHEMPLFPGTGQASETGARGEVVNAPLRAGDGGRAFRAAWEERILPRLAAFSPELVIVSAGFDAHRADPLANLMLGAEDFRWVTRAICDVAAAHADGRLVSLLEGGYDLDALAQSASAHVEVLMERGA